MKIVETISKQVDKLLLDYKNLKAEKFALEEKIKELVNENDKLERNNQDMILKIDTLLKKEKLNEQS
ncbi:hypothetical protein AAX26_01902 [Aliarcobacter thereius]|uniref:Cell division protein ZapB n=2 Tax=Aliarcobacter thereius TaxID=544718 RepID=A0A1C0B5T5_9BACT|nr:hypothetical protein [Aliarcobacter thereius]OCL85476.1 hypothetical protein AAX26_01902 [Aliarcobacter thereius]OCL90415.1 hypothetical protein AAX25_01506 [Aliarcobacter thereius]OCL95830.1 hypothetical protein AA347_01312 [Aliarcobacter thereius LMG 24486]OCL98399.1 hypothetical protein AAX29_01638 [Aliarcobacter thereius]QBF16196.1 hypothetical protein ATH_1139 [Aliarcobacter thereius LMG 24486]